MFDLAGKVALATGASRGVEKGVALGLGEARVTVYVTARSTGKGARDDAGSPAETFGEVKSLGARATAQSVASVIRLLKQKSLQPAEREGI